MTSGKSLLANEKLMECNVEGGEVRSFICMLIGPLSFCSFKTNRLFLAPEGIKAPNISPSLNSSGVCGINCTNHCTSINCTGSYFSVTIGR